MMRHPYSLAAVAAVLAPLAGCAPAVDPGGAAAPSPHAEAWVEQALAALSVRDKVAQMVMPWVSGEYMAVGGRGHDRLRAWVEDEKIGGVIISIGAPMELAAKLNALQRMADLPLLVAADVEHGPGQRLYGGTIPPYGFDVGRGTQFPPLMALGATGDEQLAHALGRITALEGRAAGIHMAFAPVVDVNNNPDNPIINTRSYGEDPDLVARMAAAHIRGLQEHGMLATAKHFPGHGDTGTDSHIELPVITADRARVEGVELVPYRAAVRAGVAAIMTAHIAFPALTGDSIPATLNRPLMQSLLREHLGFEGLVVTDALDMGGIVRGFGREEAAIRAVEAGADILLMPPDVPAAIDAVAEAVRSGRVPEARIDRSVRKLLRAKAGLRLHQTRTVDVEAMAAVVGVPGHWAAAREAAERAITLARDRQGLLPVARAGRVLSVVYTDEGAGAAAGTAFQRALRSALPELETIALDDRSLPVLRDSLVAAARRADLVLFSPFVRVRAGKGHLAVHPDAAQFVAWLAAGGKPVVVTAFGNPYVLSLFPEVGTYVLAWGQDDVVQEAAARALLGQAAITGRLPISLPPHHGLGEGIRVAATGPADHPPSEPPRPAHAEPAAAPSAVSAARERFLGSLAAPAEVGLDAGHLARADSLVQAAIASGVAPGAALVVGRHGRLVRLEGYGSIDRDPGAPAVTDSTIWDLASLSKVLGTTTAAMMLVDDGVLDLDAPLARYLPEWPARGEKGRITPRNLLRHDAGLQAFSPLYLERRGREEYVRALADLPLEHAPGTRTLYSDWGIVLLGLALERVAGMPLDRLLQERLFRPLGLQDTGFSPLQLRYGAEPRPRDPDREYRALLEAAAADPPGAALLARTAPTEVEGEFRRAHVRGVVHDENAFALGGVAGHAGLFSSARDVAVLAQMLLDGGSFGGRRFVREETLRAFTARQGGGSSRALGWDTPSSGSSAGDHFSASAFGHTGFTGTSIWIDPERDLFVVLLTNRVNPTRAGRGIAPLRRGVADAVQRALRRSS